MLKAQSKPCAKLLQFSLAISVDKSDALPKPQNLLVAKISSFKVIQDLLLKSQEN